MKDFEDFLKAVDPAIIFKKAREQANNEINNRSIESPSALSNDEYRAVFIATNLLAKYHAWLHEDSGKI